MRLQRSYMRGLALGVAGLTLMATGPAVALMCASPSEQSALNARVLQTEFMVAALTCGQQQHYNDFVTKFRNGLAVRGQTLRQLFEREYGAAATRRLDHFITRLANEASYRSLMQGTSYCTATASQFAFAMQHEPLELETLTSALGSGGQHGIGTCAAKASIAPLNFNIDAKTR